LCAKTTLNNATCIGSENVFLSNFKGALVVISHVEPSKGERIRRNCGPIAMSTRIRPAYESNTQFFGKINWDSTTCFYVKKMG
jgi:hypothetical protein